MENRGTFVDKSRRRGFEAISALAKSFELEYTIQLLLKSVSVCKNMHIRITWKINKSISSHTVFIQARFSGIT